MKLNSKMPIIIITATMMVFLGISFKNRDTKPTIENIKGDITKLSDVNIKLREESNKGYFYYDYKLNEENIPKERLPKKALTEMINYNEDIQINLIDVSSGYDLINHIGYEVDLSDKNEINLIIDEKRKDNKALTILDNEGSDEFIFNEAIDKIEINRRKIKLEKNKDIIKANPQILSSNRYKGELYIATKYYNEYVNTRNESLEIAKFNKDNESLEVINTIDLSKEVNYKDFDVADSYKYKDKFYVLLRARDYKSANEDYKEINSLYLIEYSLASDEYKVVNIDNDIDLKDGNLTYIESTFKDNKVEILLANYKKGFALKYINYDLNENKVIEKSEIKIENSVSDYSFRSVGDTLITDDSIYLTLSNRSNNYWEDEKKIYVINKNNKEIIYEGNLKCSSNIDGLSFEEK